MTGCAGGYTRTKRLCGTRVFFWLARETELSKLLSFETGQPGAYYVVQAGLEVKAAVLP